MTVLRTILTVVLVCLHVKETWAAEQKRPNVLWLTCEDMSCNLGCYGDRQAITPNVDRLAKQGVLYSHAFSVAGVCAPSRSCLISGAYPTTLGSHYMRCKAKLPPEVVTFAEQLRKAGYFCTNNVKTDYNFDVVPKNAWDQNSRKAHWRNRPKDRPFFAVFNNTVTHESQIRASDAQFQKNTARLTKEQRHDPATVKVPPFHPDVPEVRRDWARTFDLITAMDYWVGDLLSELEKDGLADDTIVFFYSDHGVGLPRGKRWLYDTGMRVPLIIRFGKNFAHLAPNNPGSISDRLVSFVDFGPTVLSLAGVRPSSTMQGIPFLGTFAGPLREAVFGIRDRMDERNDVSRAVRDLRYKYVRNYHAYKPWAQTLEYAEFMPTLQAWRALANADKLRGSERLWMQPTKPFEELYDTKNDPHEIHNLAGDARHRPTLERLRAKHLAWYRETRDLGLMPESEVYARSQGRTRFELGQDDKAFPSEKLLAAAEAVARHDVKACRRLAGDPDVALRWWGVTGLGVAGGDNATLERSLADAAPIVRVAAADGLRRQFNTHKIRNETSSETDRSTAPLSKRVTTQRLLDVLTPCLKDDNPWVRHAAALAIDEFGEQAAPVREALQDATKDSNEYVVRVVQHTLSVLEAR